VSKFQVPDAMREREKNVQDIVDEGVEDEHSLVRDTGIGVNLLQDLVDVRGVGFLADALLLLLVTLGSGRLLDSLLGGSFSSGGLGSGSLSGSRSGLLLFNRKREERRVSEICGQVERRVEREHSPRQW